MSKLHGVLNAERWVISPYERVREREGERERMKERETSTHWTGCTLRFFSIAAKIRYVIHT